MHRPASVASLACLLLALGCSSGEETADPGGPATDCKTGSNAAWAVPSGTAFALPSGVELAGDITGNVEDGPCTASTPTVEYGGDLLPACIRLENKTPSAVVVKLPAGLVFLAKDAETQNGIILQDHELTLPPGQVTSFRFALFCLNEHCRPGGNGTILSFGNVSDDPEIVALVALARGRVMARSATATAYVFGQAIWDVTGGKGLSDARKKQIADVADGS